WFARSTGKNKWTLHARFSRRSLANCSKRPKNHSPNPSATSPCRKWFLTAPCLWVKQRLCCALTPPPPLPKPPPMEWRSVKHCAMETKTLRKICNALKRLKWKWDSISATTESVQVTNRSFRATPKPQGKKRSNKHKTNTKPCQTKRH